MEKIRVGIIGCGNISDIYFKNCRSYENIEVVACSDLDIGKAQEKANTYDTVAISLEDLYKSKEIDLVLNLTIPRAHAEVSLKALQAGKHVYLEKPLSTSLEEGRKILDLANEKGLLVGAAPDTFLGGGIQTCKTLIESGEIGRPIAATAFMMSHGPESWHPNPGFFYQEGAGPLFDMGPYYLTALINLIGPVRRVTGSAQVTFPERTATSEARLGEKIQVNTPTHVAGILDFANGAVGTLITSFDVWGSSLPWIEIYGTEGSLRVPDPNTFGGPVFVKKQGDQVWREVSLTYGNIENSRGIGLHDMAAAISTGEAHRASGEMAYHVLEIMHGILTSSKTDQHYHLTSSCKIPKTLPETNEIGKL
jgi:predicted dehydrogenase